MFTAFFVYALESKKVTIFMNFFVTYPENLKIGNEKFREA